METIRVIGNPGTGKTTYLIDKVSEALAEGVHPSEILYLTFTRKAIREATDRITQTVALSKEDLRSFRTIHSLAFTSLGLNKSDILQEKEYYFIAADMGIDQVDAKAMLTIYGRCKLTKEKPLQLVEALWETRPSVTWFVYNQYINALNKYRDQTKKIDFTDVLVLYKDRVLMQPLKLLIVDEAQDLSFEQWEIIRILSERVVDEGTFYFAGDPHQAIYGWAGASVDDFYGMPVTREHVLPQSHRVPVLVQRLSKLVLSKFTDPERFPYKAKPEMGTVTYVPAREFGRIPFQKAGTGDWLVLAHNWVDLLKVQEYLRKAGIAFKIHGKSAASQEQKKQLRLIKGYVRLLTQGEASPKMESALRRAIPKPLEECLVEQTPWTQAFSSLAVTDKEQLKGLLSDTGVVISSIHAIKGGEADNVVILGDLSRTVQKGYSSNREESHMVLYVALTRCKKNLYLMESMNQYGYNWAPLLQEAGLGN